MTGRTVSCRARIARGAWAQLVGLIDSQDAHEALGLLGCASVHTAGMRFALDIAFCDASGRVLELKAAVLPWRVAVCRQAAATMTWEMRAGVLTRLVGPGDVLVLEKE